MCWQVAVRLHSLWTRLCFVVEWTAQVQLIMQLDRITRRCSILNQLVEEFELGPIKVLQDALLVAFLVRLENFSDQVRFVGFL